MLLFSGFRTHSCFTLQFRLTELQAWVQIFKLKLEILWFITWHCSLFITVSFHGSSADLLVKGLVQFGCIITGPRVAHRHTFCGLAVLSECSNTSTLQSASPPSYKLMSPHRRTANLHAAVYFIFSHRHGCSSITLTNLTNLHNYFNFFFLHPFVYWIAADVSHSSPEAESAWAAVIVPSFVKF